MLLKVFLLSCNFNCAIFNCDLEVLTYIINIIYCINIFFTCTNCKIGICYRLETRFSNMGWSCVQILYININMYYKNFYVNRLHLFWTKFMCENGEKMQSCLSNQLYWRYFFILKIRCNTNFINCLTHLVQRAMWSIVVTLRPSSVWSRAFYTFFFSETTEPFQRKLWENIHLKGLVCSSLWWLEFFLSQTW